MEAEKEVDLIYLHVPLFSIILSNHQKQTDRKNFFSVQTNFQIKKVK